MALNYTALATGALGFTVALAWNEAVHTTVRSLFPPTDKRGAARATLLYALAVTLLVIFVVAAINYAHRIANKFGGSTPPLGAAPSGAKPSAAAETFFPAALVRLRAPGGAR